MRFDRIEVAPEKLVNGQKVDWERINPGAAHGFYPVSKRAERGVAINVAPDVFPVRVEYVRTIAMNKNTGGRIAFCVTVTGDMLTFVDDENSSTEACCQLSGEYRTGEPGTNNGEIVLRGHG